MSQRRPVEILVLSDIHLGTYGCHAKELMQYLSTIDPKIIVLNGDIVDIWQFKKRYWPPSHMAVVKQIINWVVLNKPVYFIPGNHDEMLRKFRGFKLGSLLIDNKVTLKLKGKKVWIFHGDAFDVVMEHSKWLAKLGAVGYDTLILINRLVNYISVKLGKGKISLSKKVKNSVKGAVAFINQFEQTVCNIAADSGFETVICGHIHEPTIKEIVSSSGTKINYLNSGDWIENLSALEYTDGEWKLYKYHEDEIAKARVVKIANKKKVKHDEVMKTVMENLNVQSIEKELS